MMKQEWILCPVWGNKACDRIREEQTRDILATARCSIDIAEIKSVMPQNESCKNLCKYQNPVLVMAAEKDCLFPAKGVLLKAKKVWIQRKIHLLKDRGHINELTNEEKKSPFSELRTC